MFINLNINIMMQQSVNDSSQSGFLEHVTEPLDRHYSHVELTDESEVNVVARAMRYGKWYLVKGLNPSVRDQAMYRQALEKEFNILMQLNHPGVVQGVEMAQVEPLGDCIIMEWIEGTSLDKWLEAHPGRDEARRVMLQLLDAVEHIHRHGIVHRDLKPTNVMVVTGSGQVKVIDFGLADTDAHATLKQPAGTLDYMAPEQQSGRTADARNDIYSLGVMMKQMNLGASWHHVASKCLLPIGARYQSVGELKSALQHAAGRRRLLGRLTILTLLVATCLTAVMAGLSSLQQREENARLKAVGDSLQHTVEQMSRQHELQQRQLTEMGDNLDAASAANKELQQAERVRMEHARLMSQAEERGKRLIDDEWRKTHVMEHLDTLSNMRYVWPDYAMRTYEGPAKALNRYVDNLDATIFSEEDKANILNQLTKHNAEWYTRMSDRVKQIPMR